MVLDGVTGLLVPPADPEALSLALMQLLENAKLRSELGHAARERVLTHYSAPLIAEKNLEVYRQAISHGS